MELTDTYETLNSIDAEYLANSSFDVNVFV